MSPGYTTVLETEHSFFFLKEQVYSDWKICHDFDNILVFKNTR